MALVSNRGSITTARGTLLSTAWSDTGHQASGQDVFLRATTGTAYLGGTGVTALTGFPLVPNTNLTVNVDPGETLCAIRATSGTTTIRYMISSRD